MGKTKKKEVNQEVLKSEANMRELNRFEVMARVMNRKAKAIIESPKKAPAIVEEVEVKKLVTDDDYKEKMRDYFDRIGTYSPNPINMVYNLKTDPNNNIFEEPKGLYSSMNFVMDIIHNIKSKKINLMDRFMMIRFVRLAQQRILKTINTTIHFEYGITETDTNEAITDDFIKSITKLINTLIRENKITDDEIFADNNYVLQNDIKISESMTLIEGNTAYPNNNLYNPLLKLIPKPRPRMAKTRNAKTLSVPKVGPTIKVLPKPRARVKEDPKLFEMKQNSIGLFELEMDDLDEDDKLKHKEDSSNVSSEIVALKNDYLREYTIEVNKITLKNYEEEEEKLRTDQLKFFNKDLKDIRRRSQFELEMENLDNVDKLQHAKENTDDITTKITALKKEYLLEFTRQLNMLFYTEDAEASNLMKKTLQHFSERLQDIRKEAHFTYNKRIQTRVKVRRDIQKPKPRARSKTLKLKTGTGTALNSVIHSKKNDHDNVIQNPLQVNALPNAKSSLNQRVKRETKVNALPKTSKALPTPRGKRVTAKTSASKTHIEEYANKVQEMLKTIDLKKLSIPPRVKSTSPTNNAPGPKKPTAKLTPKYLKPKK